MASTEHHEQAATPEDVAARIEEAQREHESRASTEAQMEAAQTARLIGGAATVTSTGAGAETESSGQMAVEQAGVSPSHAKRMTDEQKLDALAWLLQDEEDTDEVATQNWQFNVGTEDAPAWIDWTIKALDSDTMNLLRAQARAEGGSNRAQRRASRGEADFDVTLFNLRMVAAATIEPDLAEAAGIKGVAAADPLYGPVLLLRRRFAPKPGIVDQIAGKVMLLSGYDEEDLRRATPEQTMIRAAGN